MTNSRPSLSQALDETATRMRRKRLSVKILQATDLRTRKLHIFFVGTVNFCIFVSAVPRTMDYPSCSESPYRRVLVSPLIPSCSVVLLVAATSFFDLWAARFEFAFTAVSPQHGSLYGIPLAPFRTTKIRPLLLFASAARNI
jgi:hypothetical protein